MANVRGYHPALVTPTSTNPSPTPADAVKLALVVTLLAVTLVVLPAWLLMVRVARSLSPRPDPRQPIPAHAALDAEAIDRGEEYYLATCSVCHGADGTAMKEAGKDLPSSALVRVLDDPQLIAFIRRGVDAGAATNAFKTAMPPSGGNPLLTDDQMQDIVTFLRKLQQDKQSGTEGR